MELILGIDESTTLPLYRSLATALRKQIADGHLKPGQPVPSVREMASFYNTSRSTILRAYDLLVGQGYLETLPKSGVRVSVVLPGDLPKIARAPNLDEQSSPPDINWSAFAHRLNTANRNEETVWREQNQRYSAEFFPMAQWKKILCECLHHTLNEQEQIREPLGNETLRTALVHYFKRSRAVRCQESMVAITTGWEESLDLLCRMLLRPGDVAVMEEPGSQVARRIFNAHGATIQYVSTDSEGMNVSELSALNCTPKLLFINPSTHCSSGATLSLKRRLSLLSWARKAGVLIWEDDSDNEFRYGKKPQPSLQGLSENGFIAYSSSFTGALSSIVNFAGLVLPTCIASQYANARACVSSQPPFVEQAALAQFIESGHLERHIFKLRSTFAKQRQSLIFQLKMHLGDNVKISKEASGTKILVQFDDKLDPFDIEAAAEQAGIRIDSTSKYYANKSVSREYTISFTTSADETFFQQVESFSQKLVECNNSTVNDLQFDAPVELLDPAHHSMDHFGTHLTSNPSAI